MVNTLAYDPLTLAYHELRSPLGLVATAARSVAEDSSDDALRARCEMIVRTVERMLRTTQQVFGAAQAGGTDPPEWFTPADVLSLLVSDLRGFGPEIDLSMDAPARWVRRYGVRGVFEALVQSLLSNALDHREAGARITVRASVTGRTFTLVISNPIAARPRHTGLGVGLYICDRLAGQLGGRLTASTEGAEFRACLFMPVDDEGLHGEQGNQHIADGADVAQ